MRSKYIIYKNFVHTSPSGSGRVKAMGSPLSGCRNCRPQLCRAILPFTRLPYLPSPASGCFREANCTHIGWVRPVCSVNSVRLFSPAVCTMRYSSTASRTPLRGRLTGNTRPLRLSLNR